MLLRRRPAGLGQRRTQRHVCSAFRRTEVAHTGRRRRPVLALPVVGALTLAGCGGASDAVGAPATPVPIVRTTAPTTGTGTGGKLDLVAYSVVKAAFDQLIPAFQATEAGRGVQIAAS